MKKLLVLCLALVMIAAVLPVSAITAKGSLGKVPTYKGTITIDGKKDAIYDKGLIVKAQPWNDTYKDEKSTATCYFLHDGKYLYLLVDVQSAYKLGEYNAKYKDANAWNTTGVELIIDFANKATNQNDCYKIKSWFTSEIWFSLKSLKDKVEFKATSDTTKNTFTMEYKIELQDGATTGKEIGFNAMIDLDANMGPNNDSARKIIGIQPGQDNNGANFKNITLSGEEVTATTTAAATTKAAATTAAKAAATASAKTADASVVTAAVIVTAAAAAVVLKKRH